MKYIYVFLCFFYFAEANALNHPDACSPTSIKNIENYLNRITSMQADFIQYESSNNTLNQSGRLYLMKPGSLKWEYNTPKKISIILRNHNLIYHDHELEETSNIPIKSTLYSLLISPNIKLNKEQISNCIENPSQYELRLKNIDKNNLGVIIILSTNPIKMQKIITLNNNIIVNEIRFHNIIYNLRLPKELFLLRTKNYFANPLDEIE